MKIGIRPAIAYWLLDMAHVQYISFKHRLQDNQQENFLQVFILVVESIAIKMGGGGGGGRCHTLLIKAD